MTGHPRRAPLARGPQPAEQSPARKSSFRPTGDPPPQRGAFQASGTRGYALHLRHREIEMDFGFGRWASLTFSVTAVQCSSSSGAPPSRRVSRPARSPQPGPRRAGGRRRRRPARSPAPRSPPPPRTARTERSAFQQKCTVSLRRFVSESAKALGVNFKGQELLRVHVV